jgi:hypothetical protein
VIAAHRGNHRADAGTVAPMAERRRWKALSAVTKRLLDQSPDGEGAPKRHPPSEGRSGPRFRVLTEVRRNGSTGPLGPHGYSGRISHSFGTKTSVIAGVRMGPPLPEAPKDCDKYSWSRR